MKTRNSISSLLVIVSVFVMLTVSSGELIKAVNLGGWLVAEGWMKPSLFESIPNKELLDGVHLQFESATIGKFLAAELGGGTIIVANRTSPSDWETFRLWRINETTFHIIVFNKQFLGIDSTGNLMAISTASQTLDIFEIIRNPDDPYSVRIKAPNGFFLQALTEDLVTADSNGDGEWGDNDPSVFIMKINKTLQGEYQVTNGYGPLEAPQIMKEHWDTFIQEQDFSFIAASGLNAVRIPVGWWTTKDPTPPMPYVGGSLEALDRAFLWADKYKLKVILDLHAVPGSQNGDDHSGTRDAFSEWGLTEETIDDSISAIKFYTARYTTSSSLYAVELLNEPRAPGVKLNVLERYYDAAYKVVRMNAPDIFVVLSNRLGGQPKELFSLASGMTNVAIDVHYYNLFTEEFNDMNVDQNIDFIQTNRTSELQRLIKSDGGPKIFVGEWSAALHNKVASEADYQRFATAQLQVWGRATFGWAYWSLKLVNKSPNDANPWSMEWMIKNGYINLITSISV